MKIAKLKTEIKFYTYFVSCKIHPYEASQGSQYFYSVNVRKI